MDKKLGYAIDGATQINAQYAKDNGALAIGRYLSKSSKGIRRAESDWILSHGLGLFLMWEWDGRMHGRQASSDAAWDADDELSKLGLAGAPVYFNFCDFDISPGQLPILGDCFRGVADRWPLSRIGSYGSATALKYLFDQKLITYGQQVQNSWGGGGIEERASLYQNRWNVPFGSNNVDYNDVYGTHSFVFHK